MAKALWQRQEAQLLPPATVCPAAAAKQADDSRKPSSLMQLAAHATGGPIQLWYQAAGLCKASTSCLQHACKRRHRDHRHPCESPAWTATASASQSRPLHLVTQARACLLAVTPGAHALQELQHMASCAPPAPPLAAAATAATARCRRLSAGFTGRQRGGSLHGALHPSSSRQRAAAQAGGSGREPGPNARARREQCLQGAAAGEKSHGACAKRSIGRRRPRCSPPAPPPPPPAGTSAPALGSGGSSPALATRSVAPVAMRCR